MKHGSASAPKKSVQGCAHEIPQPIAAAIMQASARTQWLGRDTPDIVEAHDAASATVGSLPEFALSTGEARRNGEW